MNVCVVMSADHDAHCPMDVQIHSVHSTRTSADALVSRLNPNPEEEEYPTEYWVVEHTLITPEEVK